MKDIRTYVGINGRIGAGAAVVGEVRELTAANQPEVILDSALARSGVGTKPGVVSVRAARDTLDVSVGRVSVILGIRSGGVDLCLSGRRATDVGSPLVLDVENGEVTGELDHSNVLGGGVEVLGGAISIDVGEKVRWFDVVVSITGFGEIVNSGD